MSLNGTSEKIEQLVFDENKIVTYKFLSQEFNLHVNQAKQILNEFIADYLAKGNNDLTVCYALSGIQKYNGYQIHKLKVVPKHQLERVKETFLMLSSVHIYSIQKTTNLNDCVLFASDSELAKQLEDYSKFSAIRHSSIKIQSDRTIKNIVPPDNKESQIFQNKASDKILPKASNPVNKVNPLYATWQKRDDDKKSTCTESTTKASKSSDSPSADTEKSDASADTQKNYANLRQKQDSKKNSNEASRVQKKRNNKIETLFSKQAEKVSLKPVVRAPSPAKCQPSKIATPPSPSEFNDKKVKMTSKSKESMTSKRLKKTKLHDLSESESDDELKKPKKKKHKRILLAETDSDSENEEERDKAQRNLLKTESPIKISNSIMSEDDEDPIPPTPPVQTSNGKYKTLKFVSKTFEDEEGFLVTQRVKEYVTASEDSESEPINVKNEKSFKVSTEPEPKLNFSNKKQASLTSFFKRK